KTPITIMHQILIVLFLTPIFALSGCVFFENSRVEWIVHNNTIQFYIGKQWDAKWIAIGFNNVTHTMPGASIYLFNGSELWEMLGSDFSRPLFLKNVSFDSYSVGDSYEQFITFHVPINGTVFSFKNENQNFLLAMNTEKVANSPFDFE